MTTSFDVEQSTDTAAPQSLRFVAVRANLVPNEVLAARAADTTRRRVLVALGALVAIVGLVYGLSWWQTHAAENDLSVGQQRSRNLQSQTASFAPLVSAQQSTQAVRTQLQHLMTGDVSWPTLLAALQAAAPRGVAVTQVSGSTSTGLGGSSSSTGGASGNATCTPTGVATVGCLTVVGTARNKDGVADYTDALARRGGLAAPYVNSITAGDGGVTFNLSVPITSAALGGRWTPTAGSSTGGN